MQTGIHCPLTAKEFEQVPEWAKPIAMAALDARASNATEILTVTSVQASRGQPYAATRLDRRIASARKLSSA